MAFPPCCVRIRRVGGLLTILLPHIRGHLDADLRLVSTCACAHAMVIALDALHPRLHGVLLLLARVQRVLRPRILSRMLQVWCWWDRSGSPSSDMVGPLLGGLLGLLRRPTPSTNWNLIDL